MGGVVIDRQIQIHCKNLGKRYGSQGDNRYVFQNLNFAMQESEFLCLLGPSGCGKTTLLRAISGLDIPTEGQVKITARENGDTANISMIFQDQDLFPWMTVYRNMAFILENNPRIQTDDIPGIVNEFLAKVGLSDYKHFYPHQLSGGMKQRVTIARSFANRPDILLMDEPFVFLDFQARLHLQSLLLTLWQAHRKTVLFVTHDIEEAVFLADRIIVFSARPANIKSILDIRLTRPRSFLEIRKSAEYQNYVNNITELLKEEMQFSGMQV